MTQTARVRVERPASDYATLMARVQQSHLLDRSALTYLPRMLWLGAMIAVGLAGFVWLGQSWWQLGIAAYFAVVFAQLGFLGHDAGHQQVFRTKRWNDWFGLILSNAGIGLSYGWWVDKHNRHHRNPNEVGRDPDVQRNVLAWTAEQADRQRGAIRVIARHQAAFFFPLLLLEGMNLHVGSVRVLMLRPKERLLEIGLLLVHVAGCVALLLLILSPLHALAFVAVQQGLFGLYLGCSFAPNHKGMKIFGADESPDFFRRQVLTSRNMAGGRALNTMFGGLNYQIEHHLFPCMPSRNLRRVQPIVRDFCAERGVSYCETTVFASYARVLRYLAGIRPRSRRAAADAMAG
jgi:fatty acid desaturase